VSETRVALITGLTGQDGSFLAEQLLTKGYEVHGLVRPQNARNTANIVHIVDKVHLVEGDLHDQGSLEAIVSAVRPDEVYNLAAQSNVGVSFQMPELTMEVTGLGARRVFEAVRKCARNARVYQASSSEMFGEAQESPQRETTAFHPRSPYAAAKVFAHHTAVHYREAYGMFISCGILFNHESERRPEAFVTRRISKAIARIKWRKQATFTLGNVMARRDWGYAPDYTDLMWRALQADQATDYVGATGSTHSVQDFVSRAIEVAQLPSPFWGDYVKVDESRKRVTDVADLRGDTARADARLGWKATVEFPELVKRMVEADIQREAWP
jgi:GDPmannose 4,6-dehydratase